MLHKSNPFRKFVDYFYMENTQANIRIKELTDILNNASRMYYVENNPVMTDYEFDMLLKELEALEKSYPELALPDSPTLKVGSDLNIRPVGRNKEFAQYSHRYPMLSLGNTYDISEVQMFADRASKGIGNSFTYSCELKFDGTAICLTYRNGKLFRALTRGDGTIGDDVTENVRHISNIPQSLIGTGWPEEFEIRGEIYMPWAAFDRLNEERIKDEEQPFANPRNAASGSLTAARLRTEASNVPCITFWANPCLSRGTMKHSRLLPDGACRFQTRARSVITSKKLKISSHTGIVKERLCRSQQTESS